MTDWPLENEVQGSGPRGGGGGGGGHKGERVGGRDTGGGRMSWTAPENCTGRPSGFSAVGASPAAISSLRSWVCRKQGLTVPSCMILGQLMTD